MDEDQLYRIYEAHIKNGASEDEAWKAVELAQQGGQSVSPEQKRLMERGGSGITDFLHEGAKGATFGASDELRGLGAALVPGGDTYAQARDKERQIQKDLEKLSPGASAMAQIAGGVALPVAAGGQSVRAGGGLLRSASSGALGGAVQGGLTGLGEGEGTIAERLPGAEKGAAIGAAGGAALGTLPFALNPAYQRIVKGKIPGRLTDLLRGTAGVEDLYTAATKANAARKAAGEALGALDAANPEITDPRVLDALSKDRFVKKAVKAVEPGGFGKGSLSIEALNIPPISSPEEKAAIELRRRLTAMREGGQTVDAEQIGSMYKSILEAQQPRNDLAGAVAAPAGDGARAPSLTDIRTVLQELRDASSRAAKKPRTTLAQGYSAAERELKGTVGDVVPGFNEAMKSYAKASSTSEGLAEKGLANKSGDELKLLFENAYPEAQQGMRTRLINDVASKINTGGQGGVWLEGMVRRQPEIIARLRAIFPDNEAGSAAFKTLTDELALEQSAAKAKNVGIRTLRASPYLAGAGAVGYGLRQLLGGSGRP